MQDTAKFRLLGVIFIVALIAIVIPIVLSRTGGPSFRSLHERVAKPPPAPVVNVELASMDAAANKTASSENHAAMATATKAASATVAQNKTMAATASTASADGVTETSSLPSQTVATVDLQKKTTQPPVTPTSSPAATAKVAATAATTLTNSSAVTAQKSARESTVASQGNSKTIAIHSISATAKTQAQVASSPPSLAVSDAKQKQFSKAAAQKENNVAQKWAILLATFSQSANASRLQKKLTQAGYTVFTQSKVHRQGHALLQVFVGPIATSEDAARLSAKLQLDYRLKGVVRKLS